MKNKNERVWTFTSESVTEGHPDKMCDQISDAILDEIIRQDPVARVAVETAITTGLVLVMGEITTTAYVDIQKIVRETIKEIGYDRGKYGFDAETCSVIVALDEQSPDIALGVDKAKEFKELSNDELDLIGAGDQGCIGKGELVHTERGFVKIENVVKGDKVLTRKGFKKVLVSKKTGDLPVIVLKTNLGRELKLTEDHLVHTEKGWVDAKDTMGLFITKAPQMEHEGKRFEEVMYDENYRGGKMNGQGNKIELTEELAYLMGFLIGDGSISGDKGVNFGFKQEDKFELIEPLVTKVFTEGSPTVNKDGVTVHGKLYRKALYDLGLGYWKSETKEVPYTILESNKEIQCEFIKGYMDADGGVVVTRTEGRNKYSCKINVGSTSRVLLNQIRLMLNNLGIDCFIGVNAHSGLTSSTGITSKFTSYRLNVRGSDSVRNYVSKIGFDLKNKKEKMDKFMETYESSINACSEEFIKEITVAEVEEVYDLEVEDEHEFFANGILVHNCMFGYASNETEEYMPLPIYLAHKLARRLTDVRKEGILDYLRPDGKSQVTIEYLGDKPVRVDTVVISSQHCPNVTLEQIREDIEKHVIREVIDPSLIDENTKIYINPTGRFVEGGPKTDSGLAGRKIIVDTYGGMGRHGGGAFSSKDPTKVDRSGAYAARYVAKNIVASGLADKCEIQLSYAIGIAKPLSIYADTFGTGKIPENEIEKLIEKHFDLRPAAIIRDLDLQRPIYKQTAAYGHFGRTDIDLPWEKLDKVEALKKNLK